MMALLTCSDSILGEVASTPGATVGSASSCHMLVFNLTGRRELYLGKGSRITEMTFQKSRDFYIFGKIYIGNNNKQFVCKKCFSTSPVILPTAMWQEQGKILVRGRGEHELPSNLPSLSSAFSQHLLLLPHLISSVKMLAVFPVSQIQTDLGLSTWWTV